MCKLIIRNKFGLFKINIDIILSEIVYDYCVVKKTSTIPPKPAFDFALLVLIAILMQKRCRRVGFSRSPRDHMQVSECVNHQQH